MTRDAIFKMASSTKPVTGVAIMMLVEESKINLADPVSRFIPEFKEMKVAVEKEGSSEIELVIPRLATIPLDFQPGTKWRYSGLAGIDTLSRIVEIASGQSYDEFLRKRFFEPLAH